VNQQGKERAREIIESARNRRVVVLGDIMLDEFVWGEVTRISPEAPVPVVDIRRESAHLGGAANVLANVIALGAKAYVVGVTGNDSAGERLRASVHDVNPEQAGEYLVVDGTRPSTTKTRIIAQNQLVVRADREHRGAVSAEVEDRIIGLLETLVESADALVISDYDKGVVTPRILSRILPLAYQRIPVLIDPKLRNFSSYRPATLITPNHHEALRMAHLEEDSNEGLNQAAKIIRAELGCDSVLVTRGDRGMMLVEGDDAPVFIQTMAREVYDVTGAGDTVIATLATALATGASMIEAATLANHAAGIVVGKLGTATTSAEELIASFE
jgi:D-beta-D-heptose 7-phosphate kinase/D-beta-D-heptose 1-phosphate adenosyltransferase